ncbi:MAG TPA: flagellar hook basal-body protein [Sedimentisphaerales bacterium]|nr:flagellar hook basal-body protein [Sedimentisphaerales bacterium]
MSDITAQVSSSVGALTEAFNTITHNLANVSTAGYKRRHSLFSRALEAPQLSQQTQETGKVDFSSRLDFSQGSIVSTERTLDFALHGNGFFVVETPEGPLYTRDGTFLLNQNHQIVNCQGNTIAGQSGAITVPPDVGLSQIYVGSDGSISAGDISIGKFRIVDFKQDQEKLIAVGRNCFSAPAGLNAQDAEDAIVKQGYQEGSNVKLVEELVNMITVSRLYESNMKLVSAKKEMTGSIISLAMG